MGFFNHELQRIVIGMRGAALFPGQPFTPGDLLGGIKRIRRRSYLHDDRIHSIALVHVQQMDKFHSLAVAIDIALEGQSILSTVAIRPPGTHNAAGQEPQKKQHYDTAQQVAFFMLIFSQTGEKKMSMNGPGIYPGIFMEGVAQWTLRILFPHRLTAFRASAIMSFFSNLQAAGATHA